MFTDCPFRTDDCSEVASCPHHLERLTLQLAQREAQLLEFWKYSPDFHCVVGSSGKFLSVSQAGTEQLGYRVEEMEGHEFLDFVHPDDKALTAKVFHTMVEQGRAVSKFRNRYRHADGYYVWVEWSSTPPINHRVYATARVGRREVIQTFSIPSEETEEIAA